MMMTGFLGFSRSLVSSSVRVDAVLLEVSDLDFGAFLFLCPVRHASANSPSSAGIGQRGGSIGLAVTIPLGAFSEAEL